MIQQLQEAVSSTVANPKKNFHTSLASFSGQEENGLCDSYLAPESEVLHFGFKVSNVGDLRSVFTEREEAKKTQLDRYHETHLKYWNWSNFSLFMMEMCP